MPKSKKYIIACSGGPDSMALLDQYQKDIVGICHVNYHFRKSANRDMKIVSDYAKKHKIPLYIKEVNPNVYKKTKFNFESWARYVRYDFFVEAAKKAKCHDILMAHHLDDWLETAVMQHDRHSQTTYYGIKENNKYKSVNIYRPFINLRKAELICYCKTHKIKYGEDETNFDTKYTRNKIRIKIAKLNDAQFLECVKGFMVLNNDLLKLEDLAYKGYQRWKESKYYIPFLLKAKPEVQRELIYKLISEYSPKRMSLNKIEGLLDFIKSAKGNISYRLCNNVRVYKKNKYLKII
ncbi:MAG: tRNA lysidine(34) synthetase TilS [Malacoplasma sp.]|nr:tRNA lysidine(34) synthetase TilS [Malacoplasma sp.]